MRPKHAINFKNREEIQTELIGLQNKWNKIKKNRKDVKIIELKFKEVKGYLLNSISDKNGFVFLFYASSSLFILKEMLKQKRVDYNSATISANTSDKIKIFMEYADSFTDEEYWNELRIAYIQQNYKKIPYKIYKELFCSIRPKRDKLMDNEELKLLKKLPDEITVYRGGSKTELKTKKFGVSWTLDKNIAENFANVKSIRDKKEMVVIEKIISKKDVVAYLISRKEEEIIYIY